jgi:hypothetical protein
VRKVRNPARVPGSHRARELVGVPKMRWLQRKRDLRPLDEAAAYARCHGDRDETVRIVKLPPRRARYDLLATGEEIRRRFEERIDAREAEAGFKPI